LIASIYVGQGAGESLRHQGAVARVLSDAPRPKHLEQISERQQRDTKHSTR
jgi:hypothetical protein